MRTGSRLETGRSGLRADAWKGRFESAVAISNDTDLAATSWQAGRTGEAGNRPSFVAARDARGFRKAHPV